MSVQIAASESGVWCIRNERGLVFLAAVGSHLVDKTAPVRSVAQQKVAVGEETDGAHDGIDTE